MRFVRRSCLATAWALEGLRGNIGLAGPISLALRKGLTNS